MPVDDEADKLTGDQLRAHFASRASAKKTREKLMTEAAEARVAAKLAREKHKRLVIAMDSILFNPFPHRAGSNPVGRALWDKLFPDPWVRVEALHHAHHLEGIARAADRAVSDHSRKHPVMPDDLGKLSNRELVSLRGDMAHKQDQLDEYKEFILERKGGKSEADHRDLRRLEVDIAETKENRRVLVREQARRPGGMTPSGRPAPGFAWMPDSTPIEKHPKKWGWRQGSGSWRSPDIDRKTAAFKAMKKLGPKALGIGMLGKLVSVPGVAEAAEVVDRDEPSIQRFFQDYESMLGVSPAREEFPVFELDEERKRAASYQIRSGGRKGLRPGFDEPPITEQEEAFVKSASPEEPPDMWGGSSWIEGMAPADVESVLREVPVTRESTAFERLMKILAGREEEPE